MASVFPKLCHLKDLRSYLPFSMFFAKDAVSLGFPKLDCAYLTYMAFSIKQPIKINFVGSGNYVGVPAFKWSF